MGRHQRRDRTVRRARDYSDRRERRDEDDYDGRDSRAHEEARRQAQESAQPQTITVSACGLGEN
jgi:hypothetical protein